MKLNVFSTCTLMVICLSSSASLAAVGASVVTATAPSTHSFKSFREWKTSMIASAQDKVKQAQLAIYQKQRNSASTSDPNLHNKLNSESGLNATFTELQQQAEKEQYQLSISKELTISDYFVGYITKQKDLSATIHDVSGRLTPEEISELMYAYANNFFSSRPSAATGAARAESN